MPKDKYCDSYRIHIGSVDDGLQAMANTKILGYAKLGQTNLYIDMVEYNTQNLVLRPGINEIALIHVDQAATQRYIHDVWIEHNGVQIPLAPQSILYGQVTDKATMKPLYQATVGINGNGLTDTFSTGPFGFYFFDTLADGTYQLTARRRGSYETGMGSGTVAMGMGSTEVVRTDLALTQGCSCPSGQMCGPSGGCLDPCILQGEEQETCADPTEHLRQPPLRQEPLRHAHLLARLRLPASPGTAGSPPVPVGNCVELACSNICCTTGQVCSAGACVTDNCAAGCAAGQTCSAGNCVDACSVITCVTPLVCQAGVCVDPCVAKPGSCDPFDGGFGNVGSGSRRDEHRQRGRRRAADPAARAVAEAAAGGSARAPGAFGRRPARRAAAAAAPPARSPARGRRRSRAQPSPAPTGARRRRRG